MTCACMYSVCVLYTQRCLFNTSNAFLSFSFPGFDVETIIIVTVLSLLHVLEKDPGLHVNVGILGNIYPCVVLYSHYDNIIVGLMYGRGRHLLVRHTYTVGCLLMGIHDWIFQAKPRSLNPRFSHCIWNPVKGCSWNAFSTKTTTSSGEKARAQRPCYWGIRRMASKSVCTNALWKAEPLPTAPWKKITSASRIRTPTCASRRTTHSREHISMSFCWKVSASLAVVNSSCSLKKLSLFYSFCIWGSSQFIIFLV